MRLQVKHGPLRSWMSCPMEWPTGREVRDGSLGTWWLSSWKAGRYRWHFGWALPRSEWKLHSSTSTFAMIPSCTASACQGHELLCSELSLLMVSMSQKNVMTSIHFVCNIKWAFRAVASNFNTHVVCDNECVSPSCHVVRTCCRWSQLLCHVFLKLVNVWFSWFSVTLETRDSFVPVVSVMSHLCV